MVSTSIFRFLLGLSLLATLSQCHLHIPAPTPPAPALPAITQDGLNTLGFRVDGVIWTPAASFNYPLYRAYYKNHTFWFNGNRVTHDKRTSFGIFIRPLAGGAGSYDLAERFDVGCSYFETGPDDELVVPRVGAGTLHLTRLDSVQRIMAGTFECEMTSPTSGRTIHITDGRFDIAY